MTITPSQCRAARAVLNLNQRQLGELTSLTPGTIKSFETKGKSPHVNHLTALRMALEGRGLQFVDLDGRSGVEWPESE